MNYYYLIFIILLIISGFFFANLVGPIAGGGVSLLGFVMLAVYLYYYYKGDQLDESVSSPWPPYSYMLEIGAQCPNYWRNTTTDTTSDTVRCVWNGPKDLNVPVSCGVPDSTSGTNPVVTFHRLKDFKKVDKDRTDWMAGCEYTKSGTTEPSYPSSWVEIDADAR